MIPQMYHKNYFLIFLPLIFEIDRAVFYSRILCKKIHPLIIISCDLDNVSITSFLLFFFLRDRTALSRWCQKLCSEVQYPHGWN